MNFEFANIQCTIILSKSFEQNCVFDKIISDNNVTLNLK